MVPMAWRKLLATKTKQIRKNMGIEVSSLLHSDGAWEEFLDDGR